MKEKQSTREKIETRRNQVSEKVNSSNRNNLKKTSKEDPAKGKSEFKVSKREEEVQIPAEMSKACENLREVCFKIEKLEKKKQKLIYVILKDVPKRKRMK